MGVPEALCVQLGPIAVAENLPGEEISRKRKHLAILLICSPNERPVMIFNERTQTKGVANEIASALVASIPENNAIERLQTKPAAQKYLSPRDLAYFPTRPSFA